MFAIRNAIHLGTRLSIPVVARKVAPVDDVKKNDKQMEVSCTGYQSLLKQLVVKSKNCEPCPLGIKSCFSCMLV